MTPNNRQIMLPRVVRVFTITKPKGWVLTPSRVALSCDQAASPSQVSVSSSEKWESGSSAERTDSRSRRGQRKGGWGHWRSIPFPLSLLNSASHQVWLIPGME